MSTRRRFLVGCSALVAQLTLPGVARGQRAAPRFECPHTGCRHYRSAHGGICGLALKTRTLAESDA